MNKQRSVSPWGRACLLGLFLAFPRVAAQAEPPPPSEATPPAVGAPRAAAALGEAREATLVLGGRRSPLTIRTTAEAGELLIPVNTPWIAELGRAFGAELTWKEARLRCRRDGAESSLAVGQTRFPDQAGGRELPVSAVELGGVAYVPSSVLQDMLSVRLTWRGATSELLAEPLITAVRWEGEARRPRLVVQASGPLSHKGFFLRDPDRYVIDLAGGVLAAPNNRLVHPEVGEIRLGQFTLGPSVARIVIPSVPGVKVIPLQQEAARELAFELESASVETRAQNFSVQKVVGFKVEPMAAGQRILLTMDGPVEYEWNRLLPPDHRFFLDIPQAVVVGGRQEVALEDPFLREVRLSQFEADPVPVARIALDLAQPAAVRVGPGESIHSLVIEVRHEQIDPTITVPKGYGATSFPAAGGVICIDPGHGGSDPGAVSRHHGTTEKQVTLDVSRRLAALLRERGWNVVMTRDDDRDVSWAGSSAKEELGARVRVANDLKADLFVSIHCNASVNSGVQGTSIHVYKKADHTLAQELRPSLVAGAGRKDRGICSDRFYVLAHSKMPAVLLELAFLSNPEEGKLLSDPDYRQRLAESIAKGLGQYASRHLRQATAGR